MKPRILEVTWSVGLQSNDDDDDDDDADADADGVGDDGDNDNDYSHCQYLKTRKLEIKKQLSSFI